ncbi:MAG: tRNA pseudouridine(13) synthase TruD [Gammaproteobacteria bacterium]|nr:tRNA pseudouridine(13) synthase TruD [Gammaproteobacteria bacterium]
MSVDLLRAAIELPFAFGGVVAAGKIRTEPEDFYVDEIPLFDPDGEGEHVLVRLQKRNSNTEWAAGELAKLAGVPLKDVGYAGQKDRHAVTQQWFSVGLAGRPEPDWQTLNGEALKILQTARHGRKLRRGTLKGNRFVIRVRNMEGDSASVDLTLEKIREQGIPNYFGEQRFGRGGKNLEIAQQLFSGSARRMKRNQKSMALSAARSLLYNRVLALRVEAGSWRSLLPGERVQLDGSRSSFLAEEIDSELQQRLNEWDIHPSAPLWGRGDALAEGEAASIEQAALADFGDWQSGLEKLGLRMERRALRARVSELSWQWEGADLILDFSLPKGSFATALLREVVVAE